MLAPVVGAVVLVALSLDLLECDMPCLCQLKYISIPSSVRDGTNLPAAWVPRLLVYGGWELDDLGCF